MLRRGGKQSGQALIYGLFMLMAGLASLFYLFNVGQLTREKTKLVNAADAVAYSAGIMQARALNFSAYTNRALMANEVTIAQMVSLGSWGQYLVEHGRSALSMCGGGGGEPNDKGMLIYGPLCNALGQFAAAGVTDQINQAIQDLGLEAVAASEVSKTALQQAQSAMIVALPIARRSTMQDVADANYAGDGLVVVDDIPLRDTFFDYGANHLPMMTYYTGDKRTPMSDAAIQAVKSDSFTPQRSWRDDATRLPCLKSNYDYVTRDGDTQLIGFDEWRAKDQATYYRWKERTPAPPAEPFCGLEPQTLGRGDQSAVVGGTASSRRWGYSGIPSFEDLTPEALANPPDPRAQFAIRLRRNATQTRTSDARSEIKTTARLNAYNGTPAAGDYAAVSAAETYFERPVSRTDGKKELASLFNPYWQTHLIELPDGVRQAAQQLQGVVAP